MSLPVNLMLVKQLI